MAGYLIGDLYIHTLLNWLQDLYFVISQPALLETSGWLVLELMPTRAVWRSAAVEHGEQCVMISGVVWMQMWPADNWASLEAVSVLIIFVGLSLSLLLYVCLCPFFHYSLNPTQQ